jgi:hypothetical protein
MPKSLFISCVFEDSARIQNIRKWADKKKLGDVAITFETEDKRMEGVESIKLHLKSKIDGAAAVVVLIGQNTHNHDWVSAEVELANSRHLKIICIRIPDSNGLMTTGAAPAILNKYSLTNFDPEAIKKALESS